MRYEKSKYIVTKINDEELERIENMLIWSNRKICEINITADEAFLIKEYKRLAEAIISGMTNSEYK